MNMILIGLLTFRNSKGVITLKATSTLTGRGASAFSGIKNGKVSNTGRPACKLYYMVGCGNFNDGYLDI